MSTIDINSYTPAKEQTFIMDTNILIKLFYPILSSPTTAAYEKLYASILSKNATLLISSIQISEFINRCIRFQYDLWKADLSENADFKKDYRNTNDYREAMNAILDIVKSDIIANATCVSDDFDQMNHGNLYQYGFSYDFNDALVAELARLKHATLITDDKDFANCASNIDIITGNRTLLMFNKAH